MEYVPLGRTGTTVTNVSFGTWRFGRANDRGEVEIGRDRAHDLLSAYAEAGGNFIDTADVYGGGDAERWIGDWLDERDREDYVLASKVYWPTRGEDPNGRGLSRKHLRRQVDLILDRLGTDYLDLLYVHRWDEATPHEEFVRTLDRFVRDGRVNHLGVSTFEPDAWRVTLANEYADRRGYEPFTVAQPRYNLVNREVERNYLDMSEHYGVGVCPWSPLAGGFLTGKYERGSNPPAGSRAAENGAFADRYLTEPNFRVLDTLREVADELDATPAQTALAWVIEHPAVTAPVIGARTTDQLSENLEAASLSLSGAQFRRLAEATGPA